MTSLIKMGEAEKQNVTAVITGVTSNLGINICYRLIKSLPSSTNLTLVVTSRTLPRVTEAINNINEFSKKLNRSGSLEFDYLLVDFTDMVSVLATCYELIKKFAKIDYLFVNAAQGVYSGIDWPKAFMEVLKNPVESATNPTYKKQKIGVQSVDGLGLVFQANVFGPYYLIRRIRRLLKGGRVIWISSLMSQPKYLSLNDLQLLKSPDSYEGSKRLVDLMHFGVYKKLKRDNNIEQYLVNPGIFVSFSFYKFLNFFTYYGMLFLLLLARLLGSTSHNISGYKAANAPVSCAVRGETQSLKVESSCTRSGKEYLSYFEVDTTGSEDVINYLENLCHLYDEKFKNQIVNTRQP